MGSSKITTKDLSDPVVEAVNTIDTVADQITTVDSNVNSIKSTVEGNSGKLDTINTNSTNLNSRLTDARAGYLDLLADGTNGLAALKTAINSVNTTVSNSGGGYIIDSHVELVSVSKGGSTSKTYTYPVYIVGNDSSSYLAFNSSQMTSIYGILFGPIKANTTIPFASGGYNTTYSVFKVVKA